MRPLFAGVNNKLFHGMGEDFWIALALQIAALIIWGARLENRVGTIEKDKLGAVHKHVQQLEHKIDDIDRNGTRGMITLAERYNNLSRALEKLEEQLQRINTDVNARLDRVSDFLQSLELTIKNNNSH